MIEKWKVKKRESDCKKAGEGDAKEGLVGLQRAIALDLNIEVKVKIKKGHDKKWQK